jgi:hypothetical protein
MKHLIWIAVVYTACNSTAGTEQPATSATAALTEENATAGTGACNNLIYFRPGAEIGSKSYDAASKELSSQLVKILDIKNEGGMTVAYVTSNDTSKPGKQVTNMKYSYKCDGKTIFFDLASMMRPAAEKQQTKFDASVIEYPIAVSAGQTLPEASGTMTMEHGGRKTTMKYHYKDRKVEGKEAVKTPAGSWNCFKITNRVEVEMDIPGMDEKAKKMMAEMTNKMKTTSITWFAPDFGVVKMEMYQNGKLQMKNEIVTVKR